MDSLSYSLSPQELVERYKISYLPILLTWVFITIGLGVFIFFELAAGDTNTKLEWYFMLFFFVPIIVPIMAIRSNKTFIESMELGWNIQMDNNQIIIHKGNDREMYSWNEIKRVMTYEDYRRKRNNKVNFKPAAKQKTLILLPKNVVNNLKILKRTYIILPTKLENRDEVMNFINIRINN